MTSRSCRSAAAVNPYAHRTMLPRLDRGEHRHTIEVRGIPPLLITCRPEDQHLTLPVVGCLVRGGFLGEGTGVIRNKYEGPGVPNPILRSGFR